MSFVLFWVPYRKSLRDERYSVLRTMGSLWLPIADLKLMNVPSIPALQTGPKETLPDNLGFWASHVLEVLSRSLVISCFSLTLLTLGR